MREIRKRKEDKEHRSNNTIKHEDMKIFCFRKWMFNNTYTITTVYVVLHV